MFFCAILCDVCEITILNSTNAVSEDSGIFDVLLFERRNIVSNSLDSLVQRIDVISVLVDALTDYSEVCSSLIFKCVKFITQRTEAHFKSVNVSLQCRVLDFIIIELISGITDVCIKFLSN